MAVLNKLFGMLNKKPAKQLSAFNISNPISFREETDDPTVQTISDKVTKSSLPVSSTAIQSARYDPSDNSLNIVYKGGGKEYKFDAKDDLQEWVDAPSKGRITHEWKESHRYPGY